VFQVGWRAVASLLTQFGALATLKQDYWRAITVDRPDAERASRMITCNFRVTRMISGPIDFSTLKTANRTAQ